jgi:hypothetical protein
MNWGKEVLAADRESARQIAAQYQFAWIKNVLLQCGLELSDCFPESNNVDDMTIEQKIKLRKVLNFNELLVLDDKDGGVIIYLEKHIIGEWKKPKYELHEDFSQLDPKRKLYTCINIEFWSVFDDEENEDEDDEDEDDDDDDEDEDEDENDDE